MLIFFFFWFFLCSFFLLLSSPLYSFSSIFFQFLSSFALALLSAPPLFSFSVLSHSLCFSPPSLYFPACHLFWFFSSIPLSYPLFCSLPHFSPSSPLFLSFLFPLLFSVFLSSCSFLFLPLCFVFPPPIISTSSGYLQPEDAGVFVCCCRDRVTVGVHHGGERYQP